MKEPKSQSTYVSHLREFPLSNFSSFLASCCPHLAQHHWLRKATPIRYIRNPTRHIVNISAYQRRMSLSVGPSNFLSSPSSKIPFSKYRLNDNYALQLRSNLPEMPLPPLSEFPSSSTRNYGEKYNGKK